MCAAEESGLRIKLDLLKLYIGLAVALLVNIKLGWKCLAAKNALAYVGVEGKNILQPRESISTSEEVKTKLEAEAEIELDWKMEKKFKIWILKK